MGRRKNLYGAGTRDPVGPFPQANLPCGCVVYHDVALGDVEQELIREHYQQHLQGIMEEPGLAERPRPASTAAAEQRRAVRRLRGPGRIGISDVADILDVSPRYVRRHEPMRRPGRRPGRAPTLWPEIPQDLGPTIYPRRGTAPA